MQTFPIQDLIVFLEQNPEEYFNFCNPRSECMLARFFQSKGIEFDRASYSHDSSWRVFRSDGDKYSPKEINVATIEGTFREDALEEIHRGNGADILERLKKQLANGTLYA